MEYLLMELFGGGIADWQMIRETGYDWHDILENTKEKFGNIENITFQDFMQTIFDMATCDFKEMIRYFIKDNEDTEDEDLKNAVEILKDFNYEDEDIWDYNTNYLDNDIRVKVTQEVNNILEEYFEDEIDEINDNIGFTYIQINAE